MKRNTQSYRTLVAVEHRVLGATFLALLLFTVWLTYAIFTKKFVDFVPVTLQTSSVGLQLPAHADVKIRGVIVGDVREIRSSGDGATLSLAIAPDKAHIIPVNASARILPKTLFGEKYVALQVPSVPGARSIAAGDVITESRVAIEVERVLNDLYPLLRAVRPVDLNYTLTAVADALEGRGEALGGHLVTLDRYLKRLNPQIPGLVADLRMLSEVSDTYTAVVPELANLLRNSVVTGRTFVEKEAKIQALFQDVASFSSTSRDFLEQNGDNIIRLGELGQAQLPLFARYSPNYPCFLKGIVGQIPRSEESFRGHELHINLEVLPHQPRGYGAQDDPVYADRRGPTPLCERYLPDNDFSQSNLPPREAASPEIADGVDYPLGKGRAAPAAGIDMTSGYAGAGGERSVVNGIAGAVMGVAAEDVPDLASLLFGPLARGAEVSLR